MRTYTCIYINTYPTQLTSSKCVLTAPGLARIGMDAYLMGGWVGGWVGIPTSSRWVLSSAMTAPGLARIGMEA